MEQDFHRNFQVRFSFPPVCLNELCLFCYMIKEQDSCPFTTVGKSCEKNYILHGYYICVDHEGTICKIYHFSYIYMLILEQSRLASLVCKVTNHLIIMGGSSCKY